MSSPISSAFHCKQIIPQETSSADLRMDADRTSEPTRVLNERVSTLCQEAGLVRRQVQKLEKVSPRHALRFPAESFPSASSILLHQQRSSQSSTTSTPSKRPRSPSLAPPPTSFASPFASSKEVYVSSFGNSPVDHNISPKTYRKENFVNVSHAARAKLVRRDTSSVPARVLLSENIVSDNVLRLNASSYRNKPSGACSGERALSQAQHILERERGAVEGSSFDAGGPQRLHSADEKSGWRGNFPRALLADSPESNLPTAARRVGLSETASLEKLIASTSPKLDFSNSLFSVMSSRAYEKPGRIVTASTLHSSKRIPLATLVCQDAETHHKEVKTRIRSGRIGSRTKDAVVDVDSGTAKDSNEGVSGNCDFAKQDNALSTRSLERSSLPTIMSRGSFDFLSQGRVVSRSVSRHASPDADAVPGSEKENGCGRQQVKKSQESLTERPGVVPPLRSRSIRFFEPVQGLTESRKHPLEVSEVLGVVPVMSGEGAPGSPTGKFTNIAGLGEDERGRLSEVSTYEPAEGEPEIDEVKYLREQEASESADADMLAWFERHRRQQWILSRSQRVLDQLKRQNTTKVSVQTSASTRSNDFSQQSNTVLCHPRRVDDELVRVSLGSLTTSDPPPPLRDRSIALAELQHERPRIEEKRLHKVA